MSLEEAKAWLRGERSMTNQFFGMSDRPEEKCANIAVADAAMTQQAYWIAKAYSEGLVT